MRGGSLKPVSAKRVKINRIYSSLREKFLKDHPYCEFFMAEHGLSLADISPTGGAEWNWGFRTGYINVPRSEDIHHKCGRDKYLLDTSTWMAVSRNAHNYIHAHPKESYEKGYMLPR
jgi:hypothetical protein